MGKITYLDEIMNKQILKDVLPASLNLEKPFRKPKRSNSLFTHKCLWKKPSFPGE